MTVCGPFVLQPNRRSSDAAVAADFGREFGVQTFPPSPRSLLAAAYGYLAGRLRWLVPEATAPKLWWKMRFSTHFWEQPFAAGRTKLEEKTEL